MRELVVAVVHQKYADIAIDAARAAGATGCTVMHTKSQGNEVVGARIGTSFREDTDTLTFLTESRRRDRRDGQIRGVRPSPDQKALS